MKERIKAKVIALSLVIFIFIDLCFFLKIFSHNSFRNVTDMGWLRAKHLQEENMYVIAYQNSHFLTKMQVTVIVQIKQTALILSQNTRPILRQKIKIKKMQKYFLTNQKRFINSLFFWATPTLYKLLLTQLYGWRLLWATTGICMFLDHFGWALTEAWCRWPETATELRGIQC